MKNDTPSYFTNESLIALLRWDCRAQAEAAETKLSEVIDSLSDNDQLRALGAFVGLDDDMARLKVFLVRMAQLTKA